MREENKRKIMEIKRIISNNLTNEEKALLISELFKETVPVYKYGQKNLEKRVKLLDEATDMYAVAIDDVLKMILTDLHDNPHQNEDNFKHLEYLLKNFECKPNYHITVDEMYRANDHQPIMRCVIDINQPRSNSFAEDVHYIMKILKEFGY